MLRAEVGVGSSAARLGDVPDFEAQAGTMRPKSMSTRFTPVSSFLGVHECSAVRRQYGKHPVQGFGESSNMML